MHTHVPRRVLTCQEHESFPTSGLSNENQPDHRIYVSTPYSYSVWLSDNFSHQCVCLCVCVVSRTPSIIMIHVEDNNEEVFVRKYVDDLFEQVLMRLCAYLLYRNLLKHVNDLNPIISLPFYNVYIVRVELV